MDDRISALEERILALEDETTMLRLMSLTVETFCGMLLAELHLPPEMADQRLHSLDDNATTETRKAATPAHIAAEMHRSVENIRLSYEHVARQYREAAQRRSEP